MVWTLKRQPRSTDWIDLTGELLNGWAAASFRIMRTGEFVIIEAAGLSGASATSDGVVTLPAGFFAARRSFPFVTGTFSQPVVHAYTNATGGLALPRSMPATYTYAPPRSIFPVPGITFPKGA